MPENSTFRHLDSDFSAPCEYVADILDTHAYLDIQLPLFASKEQASQAIVDYLEKRVSSVLEKYEARPMLMLSGGADSILLATILAKLAPNTLAVTFVDPYADKASLEEYTVASAVAADLGLEHVVTELDTHEYHALVQETVTRLDCADTWEILAGLILLACEREGAKHNATGAIFTGGGADVLFLGGTSEPVTSTEDYQRKIIANVDKTFVRARNIPDFYERLLDDADRHILTWQTLAGFELALRIPATISRSATGDQDKALIRQTLESLGCDPKHVWTAKNPMQVSSGGVDSLVSLAREVLRDSGDHTAYTDPRTESLEFVAARLFLELTKQTAG